MTRKVGNKVSWESQSGGSTTEKKGTVVYVATVSDSARRTPLSVAKQQFPDHKYMFDGLTLAIGAVFVEVRDGKTNRAKPKLYMPRLSALKDA